VTLRREWPADGSDDDVAEWVLRPRDDLVLEEPGP
jgi:hypothetical protein